MTSRFHCEHQNQRRAKRGNYVRCQCRDCGTVWIVDVPDLLEYVAVVAGGAIVLIGMALVLGVLIFGWIP